MFLRGRDESNMLALQLRGPGFKSWLGHGCSVAFFQCVTELVEWIRRSCVRGNTASRCTTPEFESQLRQMAMP